MIDTDMLEPEGPFGETNGYVALGQHVHGGDSNYTTAEAVFGSIISGVIERIQRHPKLALEPLFLNHLRVGFSLEALSAWSYIKYAW